MKTHYVIATALYCAAIFWISSQPPPIKNADIGLPPGFGIDKLGHLGAYAGLAGLVSVGMRRSGNRRSERWLFWFPVLFAALYGLTDEFHQVFVPRRTFSLGDLLANTVGGFAAQCFLWYIWWRPRRAAESPAK